jgi:hypothetical protein
MMGVLAMTSDVRTRPICLSSGGVGTIVPDSFQILKRVEGGEWGALYLGHVPAHVALMHMDCARAELREDR